MEMKKEMESPSCSKVEDKGMDNGIQGSEGENDSDEDM